MREVQLDDERGEYGQIEATERICEDDGCALVGDRSEMIQVGEAWYCPGHGQQIASERWADEELLEAVELSADLHARAAEALPDEHGDRHRKLVPAMNALASRLRGGEGERLRRAARKVARMRRSTSNPLAGGMSEALDELNEALGPVVTAEQTERVHEGHSVAVCPDCGRQQGDLHHPACPLADGDALSPTDGEEGPETREVKSWETTRDSAGVLLCASCRMQEGERHQEDCDFAYRSIRDPIQVSDAAPDTEGREEVCPYCLDTGYVQVHPLDRDFDGEPCANCTDALPEEAGGEGEQVSAVPRDVFGGRSLYEYITDEAAERGLPIVPAGTKQAVDQLLDLADRLRGAPEGAGEDNAIQQAIEDLGAFREMLMAPESPSYKRDPNETIKALLRLRTGRKERDDG